MIYDSLSAFDRYTIIPLHSAMVGFLKSHDLLSLPQGDHEILGQDLYIRVFRYQPYPEHERKFETHRLYGDVHIVFDGVEKIQTVANERLTPMTQYDTAKDIQFYTASQDITDIVVGHKEFAVFFPGESHRPMCRVRELESPLRKFVFKFRAAAHA